MQDDEQNYSITTIDDARSYGDYQTLDITHAASVPQSLQHDNQCLSQEHQRPPSPIETQNRTSPMLEEFTTSYFSPSWSLSEDVGAPQYMARNSVQVSVTPEFRSYAEIIADLLPDEDRAMLGLEG
jgi:hypothetical protein